MRKIAQKKMGLILCLGAVILAMTAAGCGGGGGGGSSGGNTAVTPPAPAVTPVVSGIVSAGLVSKADVKIYDATTFTDATTSTPIATTTTGDDGSYSVTLPASFAKPILIRVTGKADGSTSVKDEMFGATPVTSTFALESVVSASEVAAVSGKVTVHVTAYTQAMATYVSNKLGQSDVDTAISSARSLVGSKLTNNADPLTTLPTKPQMLALLAAASNIAKAAKSTTTTDPYNCAVKATNADKISCTLKTVAGILQPLTKAASSTSAATLNVNHASALNNAAQNLDVATVAQNTGADTAALTSAKAEAITATTATKDAAVATSPSEVLPFLAVPDLWVRAEMAGSLTILTGPKAGTYQGWRYIPMLCFVGTNCTSLDITVSVTPEEQADDPNALKDARQAVSSALDGVNGILRGIRNKGAPYPSIDTIKSVLTSAIKTGLAANSVSAGVDAAQAGFASAGFGATSAASSGGATTGAATPEQIAAAQACTESSSYQNPDSKPYDPQLDSNCRLAQVNACIHKGTGIAEYDPQGRAACKIVNTLIQSLTGTWSCKYCPYPY